MFTEKIETKAGWTFPQPDEDQEMQDFVESVAYGRQPLSGAALAREVTAVIYAAYLSRPPRDAVSTCARSFTERAHGRGGHGPTGTRSAGQDVSGAPRR